MTTSLKQLQESFQAYMLQENDAALSNVIDTAKVPASLRLNIYRDAYSLRLIDILAMDYPVLKKLIGKNIFETLALEYINTYPSHNFSIRVFGSRLSDFLANCQECQSVWAELANFEWKLAAVQDAADAKKLTFQEISQISPEVWGGMQFIFHPSVQLEYFYYNVADIWKALNEDQRKPRSKKQKNASAIVFWRQDQEAYFMPLIVQQQMMFKAIQEKRTFGEICEELCELLPEEQVIQFAAGTLRSWVEEGLFCEVTI